MLARAKPQLPSVLLNLVLFTAFLASGAVTKSTDGRKKKDVKVLLKGTPLAKEKKTPLRNFTIRRRGRERATSVG